MSGGAEVIRLDGDFTAGELSAIAASLIGAEAADVCSVAMVVILHPSSGEHEVRIATTIDNNPRGVASVLRHAADHAHGGCESCRAKRERRNRRGIR